MKEKTLKELRADFLKQMDYYVRFHIADDIATELWVLIFPDEASEDEILDIADDDELWTGCCVLFGKLVKRYER